ncbi:MULTISPECIES: hypothetical protein [unclassified Ensifer]|uniref:hypothetical protein n=1 Tax=unclassified Ensifer TaxID=2633371 RepID=UPI00070CCB1D|nr:MULTISPECIES: hypothetical protein [unclassified Ensifer]KQW62852.1 hypothetical protein ASD02_01650 [Ensifer sp. Root1252]KRC83673.1 hypothetical protein ASE32_01640 [Ensifer sp. Root231]KRD04026.1 hypothetical protein ASE47_00300 [Ensifer sp. Root258]
MSKDDLIILFDGNCQSHHLSAVFDATGVADCYTIGRDRGFIPSFRGVLTKYVEDDHAHAFVEQAKKSGKSVVQASQSSPMAAEKLHSFSSQLDGIVRFPHLQCLAYKPEDTGIKVDGPEQLKRLYDLDLKIIERCQVRAGSQVDFAGLVRERQVHAPMFHMTLHAGALITALLVKDLARQLGDSATETVSEAAGEIERTEGINFVTHHPLDDRVLSTLGFQWEGYDDYRKLILSMKSNEFEFVLNNEDKLKQRFGHETIFWQAMMRARTISGDFVGAFEASDVLQRRCPGSVMTWFDRVDCERKAGATVERIDEILETAEAVFNGSRQFLHLRALVKLRLGRADDSLQDAEAYFRSADELFDSIKPMLRTLLALGRVEEAKQALSDRAAAIQMTERRRLASAIRDLPQLASAADEICRAA